MALNPAINQGRFISVISKASVLRLIIACSIGSVVEWYDFFIFATAAVLIFDKAFFPTFDPLVGVLLGLLTYGAGFLSRPVGGILFGYLGDRKGRKIALFWSLTLMGVATAAIGLIPDYASIGVLAPMLLVTLRIIQGFAVGGEVGGAVVLISESLDPRKRAFWIAGPMSGPSFGNALGAGMFWFLGAHMSPGAFTSWGWRIAFLFSLVLVVIGTWLRSRVAESPAYLRTRAALATIADRAPTVFRALAGNARAIVLMVLLRLGENTFFYIVTTFLIVYASRSLHYPRQAVLTAILIASVVEGILIFPVSVLCDRIGRRPTMMIGYISSFIWVFAMFPILAGGAPGSLAIATIGAAVAHVFIASGEVPMMVEIFPVEARYTAFSTSFQIGALLSGAIAPPLAVALLQWSHSTLPVSVYSAVLIAVSIVVVFLVRETRPAVAVE